jgi:hypothetical protein
MFEILGKHEDKSTLLTCKDLPKNSYKFIRVLAT